MTKTDANKRKRKNMPLDLSQIEYFDVQNDVGLSGEQVADRIANGLVNDDKTTKGKTVLQIILSNTFTFFNIVYIVIAAILLYYGMPKQCTFLPVVAANTLIAIVQEIKSKRTLDKLNLLTEPKARVVRDGAETQIAVKEMVLDDIVCIAIGEQISADCVVLDGFVEVNESILTGESDAMTKRAGDTLYAGSFVVSGSCTARVTAVGAYNYINGLTSRARVYRKPRSQMLKSLKNILVFVAIIIVPMTACLFIVNGTSNGVDWGTVSVFDRTNQALLDSVRSTSGSIISMIPAGPFLLTSVALGASFLRLSKNNTLAQELYCIEMLARVDTLCLDKTGTITDGKMRVVEAVDLRPSNSTYTVREIMAALNSALKADNMTAKALNKYFGCPKKTALTPVCALPFSSERKLSAVSFRGVGTYILGAPEFVMTVPNQRVTDMVQHYAEQGLRVLLLAYSTTAIAEGQSLPTMRRPVAVIVIEDHIRTDAPQTIEWFVKNGVNIKIISGDNPTAVSNIALRVGVENADKYISLEGMSDEDVAKAATEYTVFGRVSPDQKAILVRALRASGKTVAMTGDGVNDILAMKESDCSISLAGGSDAARKVSHLILMNDSFAQLTKVVAEGRRVVNNIQSATSMYFMKTVYVIAINIMIIFLHFALGQTFVTPLTNSRIMLLEWVIVALPTTILALQPNESLIRGNFLVNVIKRCLPASCTFIVVTCALYLVKALTNPCMIPDNEQFSTLVTISYTFGGLFALFYATMPFDRWWKKAMYGAISLIVVLGVTLPFARDFFEYVDLTREQVLLLLVAILASPFLLYFFARLFNLNVAPTKGKRKKAVK